MHITHVIDYFHTDVGYQEFFLARDQALAGHHVRVVTSTNRHHTVAAAGPDEEEGQRELEAAGVDIVRLPARQLGHDRAWLRGLHDAVRAFAPDAIHCHGPFAPTTLRAARTANAVDAPILVDNHMQRFIAPRASSPAGRAFYGTFRVTAAPWLRRRVDDWVAIGPYEAEFLAERMSLPEDRIGLVPLGFDARVFRFDEERRAHLRDEWSWEDDLVVTVTGKLNPRKRVDLVAKACASMAKEGRDMRLVLAGHIEDEELRAVRREGSMLQAENRLTVLPMLPRRALADLYLAADAVVFPRLPSISIYEAAGTGVRVVLGRDRFGHWLADMHSEIVPADPEDLGKACSPVTDRTTAAQGAAAVFEWSVISRTFVDRYEAMRK